MPDYEMVQSYQVMVTVYGKTLNDQYTHILFDHPELDLETVFLLDRIQKGKDVADQDLKRLLEQKLIRLENHQVYLTNSFSEMNGNTENEKDTGIGNPEKTDTKTDKETENDENTDTKTGSGSENDENTGTKTIVNPEKTNTKNDRGTGNDQNTGTKTDLGSENDENTGTKTKAESENTDTKMGKETDNDENTDTKKNKKKDGRKLTGTETSVIVILKENPSVTIVQLSEKLQMSVNGVRYVLRRLTEKGLLSRSGSRKKGEWIVSIEPSEHV